MVLNVICTYNCGRDEFMEVFKNYFYEAMIKGGLRICLYGYQAGVGLKGKHKKGHTVADT